MDTFWPFRGWCLVPLLFLGLMAVACIAMAFRGRGGCGCTRGVGSAPPAEGA